MVKEVNEPWEIMLFFVLIIVGWCVMLGGLGLLWQYVPWNYAVGFSPAIAWGVYSLILEKQRKKNAPLGVEVGQTFDDRCFVDPAARLDSIVRRAKAESRRG